MSEYNEHVLAHYGVKGMRWGVRKARADDEPRNPSYSNRMQQNDRMTYGRRGVERINKAMNEGSTRPEAQYKEYKRQYNMATIGGIAAVAGYAFIMSGAGPNMYNSAANSVGQRAEANRGARAANNMFANNRGLGSGPNRARQRRDGSYNVRSF